MGSIRRSTAAPPTIRPFLRPNELEAILPFASERQGEHIRAVLKHGNFRAAAEALGCSISSISSAISRVERNAAVQGIATRAGFTHQTPPGFVVERASSYYNEEGELAAQWVKIKADATQQIREAIEALKEDVPRAKIVVAVKIKRAPDLLNLHVLTDYHLGMKAWREEAGEDWDLAIAEDLLVRWFTCAIENAPFAEVGVLAQLGDFLHWDGLEAVTPTNRNVLDADTRFQKIVRVAIRILRRIVAMMLQKYKRVHLIVADANHDPASGVWLREVFSAFYEKEKRITVDRSADTYYCLEHGLTSLFFHHGHKRKPENVDDVMVAKFREVFGRTKFSYCHLGHLHHDHLIETNLMTVEQHRTMAAKDAYAARGGWMAGRGAQVITYSSKFGEVGRQGYTPEMV